MSHFALVKNGIVEKVIVAEQDYIDTLPDKEYWLQTSYNTRANVHYGTDGKPSGKPPLRGNFAGVGHIYFAEHDVFIAPKPSETHYLDTNTWTWRYKNIPQTEL